MLSVLEPACQQTTYELTAKAAQLSGRVQQGASADRPSQNERRETYRYWSA